MTSAPRVGQEDSMMATKAEAMSREPFGRWLIAQRDRGDWIDELANAARTDLAFPKDGDPEVVRKRLSERGADGEMSERQEERRLGKERVSTWRSWWPP